MKKPDSLRAALMAMIPELAQRPDNLEMWVEHGRIAATGERSNGWRWHYTLRVLVKDFSGDLNMAILPLIPWLRLHQLELLRNPDRNKTGLKYQVDQLNHSSCDILLDIECDEIVIVRTSIADGVVRAEIVQPDTQNNPTDPGQIARAERWELWLRDAKLAEWSSKPIGWPDA